MNLHLQQQFAVDVPRQAMWDFLMDAPAVGKCMPGVQAVEPLGGDSYRVQLAVGIGPIQAKLNGKVAITETCPPDHMLVRIDWKDSPTDSKVGATAEIRLEDAPGDGRTLVVVDGQLSVIGALGKYGQPIANKKAAEITETFATNVRFRLEAAPAVVVQRVSPWTCVARPLRLMWEAIRSILRRRPRTGPPAGER